MMKEQFWKFFKKRKRTSEKPFLGILEENGFCSEKWSIFRKNKTEENCEGGGTRRGEGRQTGWVSQKEMKKDSEKGDWMKHEGLGKRKKTQCFWKETVQQEK